MVVQHNMSAMNANRHYTNNNSALGKSMEKLSSGLAINRAGDNAAGLAVSEKMRAQISGLTQASKNAQDGISMVQTFEGALQETDTILQRMRTLAVQSANGSYQNDVDRDAMQLEFDQLNDELNQIADTDYNGTTVLNGGKFSSERQNSTTNPTVRHEIAGVKDDSVTVTGTTKSAKKFIVQDTNGDDTTLYVTGAKVYRATSAGNAYEEVTIADAVTDADDPMKGFQKVTGFKVNGEDFYVKLDSTKPENAVGGIETKAVSVSDAYTKGSTAMQKMKNSYTDNLTLQVGARSKDAVKFTFSYSTQGIGAEIKADMDCSASGLGTDKLSLKTADKANEAIDKIDNAINKVSMVRGTFGAIQNRLEHKINNIDTNAENLTAAESRIRDTQMDQEMMKFTSAQILSQASQSMLAQANSLPQGVLQLLG